jgi:hypothetical protein
MDGLFIPLTQGAIAQLNTGATQIITKYSMILMIGQCGELFGLLLGHVRIMLCPVAISAKDLQSVNNGMCAFGTFVNFVC